MKIIYTQMRWPFWGVAFVYVMVFGVFFGRGFDITDESYYLINYMHWNELAVANSFFGAYLAILFYSFGESIWAIRFFGLLMLMAGAYYFALELFKSLSMNGYSANYVKLGAITVSCAAVIFYSVFGTLYTPGYNLLNLVLMLFSTGMLLRISRNAEPNIVISFLYGFCMGVILFNKFPSFFMTFVAHFLMMALTCTHGRWWLMARLMVAILVGTFVNYGWLALQAGNILKIISLGMETMALINPRNIMRETLNLLISDIPNIVLGSMARLLPTILSVVAISALTLFPTGRIKDWPHWGSVLVIFIAFSPLGFLSSRYLLNSSTWTAIGLLWVIWLFGLWGNKDYPPSLLIKNTLLAIIVALLPVAHSFGTGNSVQLAVGMAAVFPISICIWLLITLRSANLIGQLAFTSCLGIISLAPLFLISMQWTQPDKTYRLLTGLNDQNINVKIGKAVIAVDDKAERAFQEFRTILREHGYTEGTPMLDMTGSPGLILVANGRPLGTAWMAVGYPGSQAAALRLLEHHVKAEDIRAAWILSTPTPKAGLDWIGIMRQVLGSVPFKKVGDFCLPVTEGNYSCTSAGGRASKTIEVWAPLR